LSPALLPGVAPKIRLMRTSVLLFTIFYSTVFNDDCPAQTGNRAPVDNRGGIILQGVINDHDNGGLLAYVSVGIVDKPIGTMSDSNGHFKLMIENENLNDTLQVSMIGYATQKIGVRDLVPAKDKIVIGLQKKALLLDQVVVANRKTTDEIAGRQSSGMLLQVSICAKNAKTSEPGSEIGMKIKPGHLPALLKEFDWYLSSNNFEHIKFRVHIYSLKNNLPDSILTGKEIYTDVTNTRTGWIRVDLKPFNIMIEGDFVISIQWVEGNTKGGAEPRVYIPASLSFTHTCYYKIASQDKWKKNGANLSYHVTLGY
jgi:hypothetical protein